ncbi:MAG: hypothetical protein R3E01_25650 [Pirellulaceae bacterium]|nr:hypothetical protein [Planctomycetales bacterium]
MGQRANLILVADRQYELYYSHWCANTLPRDLFWGPDHATKFVQIQRSVDESGWLDNIWAEGGAVVDRDNKVLMLFGGEDVLYDVPLRRVYLQMLQRVWGQWTVRWAHQGIADLADYVAYPRYLVCSEWHDDVPDEASPLAPPERKDGTNVVGTVRLADGTVRVFPLAGSVASYLFAGPDIVAHCPEAEAVDCERINEWCGDSFPLGGFHIDMAAKSLDYWTAFYAPEPVGAAMMWPGWQVTWHRDRYESQVLATDGRLAFPFSSTETLQQRVSEMLLRESRLGGVAAIRQFTNDELAKGSKVTVNPWALRNDDLPLDRTARERIVAFALGAVDSDSP